METECKRHSHCLRELSMMLQMLKLYSFIRKRGEVFFTRPQCRLWGSKNSTLLQANMSESIEIEIRLLSVSVTKDK